MAVGSRQVRLAALRARGHEDMEIISIKTLNKIGWWLYVPFLMLTLRLTWEKTYLTWSYGSQNIGFALAHGYYSLLFFAPFLNLIWTVLMVVAFLGGDKNNLRQWRLLIISLVTWLVLLIPFDLFVLSLRSRG